MRVRLIAIDVDSAAAKGVGRIASDTAALDFNGVGISWGAARSLFRVSPDDHILFDGRKPKVTPDHRAKTPSALQRSSMSDNQMGRTLS
jgi:hypothetical protein